MTGAQQNEYLESKVLTAPPHKLHLMLIEGALRLGRQGRMALQQGDQATAQQPLSRMIDIVGEMLIGVRESQSEVNQRLVGLYAFVLRRLAEARIDGSIDGLDEVLGLLEYERETWQLVCRQQEAEPGRADSGVSPAPQNLGVRSAPLALHNSPAPPSAGISLEA